ncbi:MAG: dolichyl-phosphate beta-glucosyltransferase [Ilumatobacteraceae bacterium]
MAIGAPQLPVRPPNPLPGRTPRPADLVRPAPDLARPPTIEIVVPTHDEAHVLVARVTRLHRYLREQFPLPWRITIADNGSSDDTPAVARRLANTLPGVSAIVLSDAGRGGALRAAWMSSTADIVAYTDVDLSTDLDALLPLVAPLVSGHSAVAVGSRLAPGSRTHRGPRRELISRGYNALVRVVLRSPVRDAQCGFKAMRSSAARQLLPIVRDDGWFFDTELIVRARRAGLRVFEVPVDWIDDPDSRVRIVSTAWHDLKGVARLAVRERS